MFLDFLSEVFKENKEKTAIIYKENNYTYEYLLEAFNKWKKVLQENIITENAVVSLKADFSPYSIPILLAMVDMGCICVPFSYEVKNYSELMEIAEVEYEISFEGDKYEIKDIKIGAKHEILQTLKNRRHPGLILFSSGTTGKPKAAVHDIVPLLNKFKIPGKTLTTISFLLFDHIGGFNTLLHILSNAGTLVTLESRSPEEVCRLINKYDVELLPTSPSFINMILFSRAYEKYNISCLKIVSYGTEPMPEATLKTFNKLFPNIILKQTYGLSEIGIMRTKSESSDSLWLKVGGEDYETKIVDDKLWIKAKTAMLGYLNAPSPFTEDGWFNTNDRVEIKGEYMKILGRESDIINVGGQKVYPINVESVLLEFPGVKDASVRGESNPIMGSVVVATISVDEENDNKEFILKIRNYCKARLDKYKIPVKIELVRNAMSSSRFKRTR